MPGSACYFFSFPKKPHKIVVTFHPHFIAKETEVQRSYGISQGQSCGSSVAKWGVASKPVISELKV